MQAMILAAGMGKRLKDLTANNTKCMVKVNGVTLIERMLSQLDRLLLTKIVIVVGYEGQHLIDFIDTLPIKTPIQFVENPIYYKTNNIYSLYLAKEHLLSDDTLLLESDGIFEDAVLTALLEDPRETLALVDKYESWMDGTVVKLNEDDSIQSFIPGKDFVFRDIGSYYKTVNVYKFSRHFSESHYIPFLDAYCKALGNNEYYEQVLRVITMLDEPEIHAKRLSGQKWYEIDDIQDLDIAESMFADDAEKTRRLTSRYGGFWRYPHLLDFCYLVNPYFPPQRLIDEMQANFTKLLTQYPSGMRVNALLAAKNFGVHPQQIVVGNGAAELIKSLMALTTGLVGFVRPTFEEYPNRYAKARSVSYFPQNSDFSYTSPDLEDYFTEHPVETLVVVNPDNPSGNYLKKAEVLHLIDWAEASHIRLCIDESFADFADEPDNSLLDAALLAAHPGLLVVKSISKSYGVPGLRLGVLASGDAPLIAAMKQDVAIWNINSFGEFYLQIAEKYKKDYLEALSRFRAERVRFLDGLQKLPGLRLVPTQANYVMVELTDGRSAQALTEALLTEQEILVKDLTGKVGGRQYLRIAIRNHADNDVLLRALAQML
ncbi:MAG: aminotransferase class I/II-fold pyridoxal phosphate-dependent enzyme [Oscillospiraceae bacterium]|nr:aminotransferase class I/II-fold pyridoxal phosphate-dependent enzyme [Oscillospiraceae bacterium]